jgi:translation initiation factor 5B
MQELRVKGEYMHHQKIKGAMGIKISAPGMELGLPGSELHRCSNDAEIEEAKLAIEGDINDLLERYVDKTHDGVLVQASTIGSLEALLEFLKQMKIPVSGVNIGPIHKKDVLKACKAISQEKVRKEYATILAFDVRVMPEAQSFADENNITIFTANIIYHLFDAFTEYVKKCVDERKSDAGNKVVFPCIL